MSKRILFTFLMISLITITACHKKTLSLGDNVYTLQTFLNSANCDAHCYETAQCEGKTVRLKGILDRDNINRSHHHFYLVDVNHRFNMEVKVADNITDDIFDVLEQNPAAEYIIKGKITGYDAATNFSCRHQFFLSLNNTRDLEISH
jgi:hypothetical protein